MGGLLKGLDEWEGGTTILSCAGPLWCVCACVCVGERERASESLVNDAIVYLCTL